MARPVEQTAVRVLVVDDDASFADLVAGVLTERGYLAVATAEPSEGLRLLSQDRFAVAIVDLVMPGMGGLEFADRLRAQSPDTQVVILTGQPDLDSAVEGIRQGVFDYLEKAQLHMGRLLRSVESAVDRSGLVRHNRELVAALSESNDLLKGLHASSAAISGAQHIDRLLSQVVQAARETCRAESARVVLFDRSHTGELVVSGVEGPGGTTLRGLRLRPGQGILGLALERDEAVGVAQPAAHPRYDPRCDALPTSLPGLVCSPLKHRDVLGVLVVAGSRRPGGFGGPDQEALTILARQAAVAIDNALGQERAVNFFTHASGILVEFIEAVDVNHPGHSSNVAVLSDMLSRRLGLSDAERRNIHFGALLHDIGKVRLERSLMRSTGALPPGARARLEQHPALGLEILKPITLWEEILAIVHAHHERWDGKGYPRGLAGDEIPLGARIVAVAEAYDVMTCPTAHARERDPGGPLAELEACSGTQFDPRIVRLFLAELREHGDPRLVR
jgi:putative nucleotidyltransferase with HDIG domain